jgi:hypothetical protein
MPLAQSLHAGPELVVASLEHLRLPTTTLWTVQRRSWLQQAGGLPVVEEPSSVLRADLSALCDGSGEQLIGSGCRRQDRNG